MAVGVATAALLWLYDRLVLPKAVKTEVAAEVAK